VIGWGPSSRGSRKAPACLSDESWADRHRIDESAELARAAEAANRQRDEAERQSKARESQAEGDRAAQAEARSAQVVLDAAEVNAPIAQLAGQTNLLSLNATIEAARAGELIEITRQLSTAADASREMVAGLDRLTANARA
jgi:methyl-accepting chemotaxis protein